MSLALEAYQYPDLVKAELAKRSLHHFVRQAWPIVEPAKQFKDNWHLGAICEHLEALHFGEIPRLVINVPPRTAKSTICSVCFPAWVWINEPSKEFLYSSYSQPLADRDSVKCRRLINSEWYTNNQELWDSDVYIVEDQNQKRKFETTRNGHRIATSITGLGTGEGGDLIGFDDPHNIVEGESDAVRQTTVTNFKEVFQSRLNDRHTGAIFVIMQRVHEDDVSSEAITEMGYEHLNLQMEYKARCIVDVEHKCSQPKTKESNTKLEPTSIDYKDPRKKEDELLQPERFNEEDVESIKNELGPYAYACQHLQEPEARHGSMFNVDMITIVDAIPSNIEKAARGIDKAATEGGGAYTALGGIAKLDDKRFIIFDMKREQYGTDKREQLIKSTAEEDGPEVDIVLEKEGGSGGKSDYEATVKNLAGYNVIEAKASGDKDKAARATPLSVQVNVGNVLMLRAAWNKALKAEMRRFPDSKYKDQVDALAHAFNHLTLGPDVQVF